MQTQTIRQYYGEDHQRLDELFHRFQELKKTDAREASQIFSEFKAGLERHIIWEEEILFAWLDAKIGHPPDGWTALLRWEHRHLRRYLARVEQHLAQQNADAELERIAFLALLGAHNRKEERILYPRIDQIVSDEERSGIFSKMQSTHSCAHAVCGFELR